MAKKALLQGSVGDYRIRGTIWELGSFAYRAYVHLIPTVARSTLHRWVVSADGMSVKEVLGATEARVNTLEIVRSALSPQPSSEHLTPLRRRVPRRYPPPTD